MCVSDYFSLYLPCSHRNCCILFTLYKSICLISTNHFQNRNYCFYAILSAGILQIIDFVDPNITEMCLLITEVCLNRRLWFTCGTSKAVCAADSVGTNRGSNKYCLSLFFVQNMMSIYLTLVLDVINKHLNRSEWQRKSRLTDGNCN